MTAITEQFNLLSLPSALDDAFAALEDNFYFLMLGAVREGKVFPGWSTTIVSSSSPLDYSKPDSITLSKTYTDVSPNVTKQVQAVFTYTGSNPTTIVFKFDRGAGDGLETVTGGTMTCTYDASGNLITATPS